MQLTLWIFTSVLSVTFAANGLMKQFVPKDQLVVAGQGWAQDYNATSIRLIGLVEILGAIGLALPPAVHVAPILTPLAAIGLALVMIGAAALHARRKEARNIVVNLVLLILAVIVALGRLDPWSLNT
ncbi:DoxX family protein [Mycobacterium montefiorense]|uniref:DoxX family protein n=1 Tax=Mycobacterium montefiorense TaxID=154654 RepID=UPI0021DD1C34|nr:DoxX family protein [Mycobacterium montefiorense]MCV7426981.1 DoxX family protein [Mycobacterium montefiorense]GLE51679.1 hypothetical protein ATCCBAA256_12600 [Mycobacterium montefiorense]